MDVSDMSLSDAQDLARLECFAEALRYAYEGRKIEPVPGELNGYLRAIDEGHLGVMGAYINHMFNENGLSLNCYGNAREVANSILAKYGASI